MEEIHKHSNTTTNFKFITMLLTILFIVLSLEEIWSWNLRYPKNEVFALVGWLCYLTKLNQVNNESLNEYY